MRPVIRGNTNLGKCTREQGNFYIPKAGELVTLGSAFIILEVNDEPRTENGE
jgi:hypothetical protein